MRPTPRATSAPFSCSRCAALTPHSPRSPACRPAGSEPAARGTGRAPAARAPAGGARGPRCAAAQGLSPEGLCLWRWCACGGPPPPIPPQVRRGPQLVQDTLVQVHHAKEQGALRKPLKVRRYARAAPAAAAPSPLPSPLPRASLPRGAIRPTLVAQWPGGREAACGWPVLGALGYSARCSACLCPPWLLLSSRAGQVCGRGGRRRGRRAKGVLPAPGEARTYSGRGEHQPDTSSTRPGTLRPPPHSRSRCTR